MAHKECNTCNRKINTKTDEYYKVQHNNPPGKIHNENSYYCSKRCMKVGE